MTCQARRVECHYRFTRTPNGTLPPGPVPRMVGDGFRLAVERDVPLAAIRCRRPCIRSAARPLKTAGTFHWNLFDDAGGSPLDELGPLDETGNRAGGSGGGSLAAIACRAGRNLPGDVLPGAPGNNGRESTDLRHLLGEA